MHSFLFCLFPFFLFYGEVICRGHIFLLLISCYMNFVYQFVFNIIETGNLKQVNDSNFVIQDSDGNIVEGQYIPLDNSTINLRNFYTKAYLGGSPKQAPMYWLLFQASVPPLGWSTYFISKVAVKGRYPFCFSF